jgi:dihydrolipoamide dehydrogenase
MRLAILGAGPGGYVAAIKAVQSGALVTLIEADEIGGTCLNRGCIPTKALAASSAALARCRRLEDFGMEFKGEITPNFSKILERKNRIVATQLKGIKTLLKNHRIIIKEGRGTLISRNSIQVALTDGSQNTVDADRIIIATGSRPAQTPAFPFDGERILSSNDMLQLKEIPKSLLIVGAGFIGCEFAGIFRELGSEVTIIEMLPRAVAAEDTEISALLEREFRKRGIKLFTAVRAEKVEIRRDGVHVFLSDGKEVFGEKVLVAAGRTVNTDNIGIERIGIDKGKNGEILVNEKMETNVPGIYAIGDVIGGPMLAHVAYKEGKVAAQNALDDHIVMDYTAVPAAIFTSPEIASVGIREQQAQEKGIKVKTGHCLFRTLAKAHIAGEIEGMIKVVSDASSDLILGVHIIGPHASELIHEAALAIQNRLKTSDIAKTMHVHPTLSEVMLEAAENVHGEAIHISKQ